MRLILSFISILLLSGCAMTYKTIDPEQIPYYINQESDGLRYSYIYDVLSARGNKRYAKKESKYNIKVVAVKLTNQTKNEINFSRDIIVRLGDTEIIPMAPVIVKAKIHQFVPIYALYSLLFLQVVEQHAYSIDVKNYPIGIPIAVGNIIVAGVANQNFLHELEEYDLSNSIIQPGETKHGILCFHTFGNLPISLSLKNMESESNDEVHKFVNQQVGLQSGLYILKSDSSYIDYFKRVQPFLEQDIGIISYELLENRYRSGKLDNRGLKARHRYGINEDFNYQIGSWEYYSEDGVLEKVINYDLKGNISGVTKY